MTAAAGAPAIAALAVASRRSLWLARSGRAGD